MAVAFHTDPRGTAYELLIDELIEKADRFMLVDRKRYEENEIPEVVRVLEIGALSCGTYYDGRDDAEKRSLLFRRHLLYISLYSGIGSSAQRRSQPFS